MKINFGIVDSNLCDYYNTVVWDMHIMSIPTPYQEAVLSYINFIQDHPNYYARIVKRWRLIIGA
jgi:hypothetical protein